MSAVYITGKDKVQWVGKWGPNYCVFTTTDIGNLSIKMYWEISQP